MADRRSRLDFAAYGLLVAGLVVALSVFSYDPADPPGAAVFPPHETAKNILGSGGAWLAQTLHETLGIAVHILLASWFVLVVLLFLRQSLVRWSLRLLGWLLLIPCAAVAADYFSAYLPPGPLAGGGGSLGAWLRSRLEANFQPLGSASLLGGSVFLGLVLTADFLLLQIARGVWLGALSLGRRTLELCRWLKGRWGGRESSLIFTEVSPFPVSVMQIRSDGESPTPPPPKAGEIPIRHHDLAATTLQAPGGADVLLASQRPTVDSDGDRFADFELPALSLLAEPQPFPYEEHDQRLRERAALLEKTFRDFGLNIWVVGINTGPVITQYEVALETGLRVHKVTGLGDDLALNLKVPSVRIVAPIPGKNTVGIEIPNEHRAVVRLKEVILAAGQRVAQAKIPLFLGKDTEGRPLVYDLAEMPHLLIAGRTGTGKSVCMNAIILSILMTRRPDDVKMVMIDPKMLELSEYGRIPHLMHPVVKDMKKAEAILSWAVDKMEERYDLLSRARVRGIAGYNELSLAEIYRRVQPADDEERRQIPAKMPYIAIFVDELNDLMMTMKKEVEGHIIRLAQKSRAAGIHLVVATQKPTVDVITGLIKSNLPARICFQVSSRTDSRVVLDEMGADKLLGKGDMLFLQPGTSTLLRAQGTYASDEEITRVVQNLECEPCYAQELVQLSTSGKDGDGSFMDTLRARDDLYEQAIQVIIREGRGSVSLLQRALGIGYGRAARLIDFMAEDGIVGNYNGSQAREVLYTPEQWEQVKQAGAMH
ncbi:MAG TPA: DNA translocase FtsK 4TM domain-containing protein [Gemmataceae bacterium]|nr:DNA translocase FtsK 4TM domain-containing protein [Gemmataceae bacterium]